MDEIIESLKSAISESFSAGIENVNCDEMGKAMDMLKDAYMCEYYKTVTEAMEHSAESMSVEDYKTYTPYRDMDRMYFTEKGMGKSGMSRKGFIESKAIHNSESETDRMKNRAELDKWLADIAEDVKEVTASMTNEEKTVLRTKLTNLASTI